MAITYEVTIGSQSLTGSAQPLVGLHTEVGIGGAGHCLVRLGDVSWTESAIGDALSVALDPGDGSHTVFTGVVEQVVQRADALLVQGWDALVKLARTEVESSYEEVTAGFIVADLIDQAGAEAGEIEDGPTFPSYVVHRGPRALRHAQRLAQLIGAELGSDGTGQIHFRRPADDAPEHQLVWGEDFIAIDIGEHAAAVDSFAVWGEGAAGTNGPERSHWLVTDLSGVSGQAAVQAGESGSTGSVTADSTGPLLRTSVDGAVRSAETASEVAQARAQLLALRPVRGHVIALGRPAIQPGQWVELAALPSGAGAERSLEVRVLRVSHELSLPGGLITRLEF
jgi:hypothetical protein